MLISGAAGCGQRTAPAGDTTTSDPSLTAVDSSLIKGVKYDAAGKKLTVAFTDGDTYEYSNVGQDHYDQLMAAKSKGKFFQENIRDHFDAKKL
jgi:hypothetical protein